MSDCPHPFVDDPIPSAGVLAGGCDLLRCPRCSDSWLVYREGDELVVYGRGSDGMPNEVRYALRER